MAGVSETPARRTTPTGGATPGRGIGRGGGYLERRPMLKRLVHWIIFIAVCLHAFGFLMAALGEPAFLPALPR